MQYLIKSSWLVNLKELNLSKRLLTKIGQD